MRLRTEYAIQYQFGKYRTWHTDFDPDCAIDSEEAGKRLIAGLMKTFPGNNYRLVKRQTGPWRVVCKLTKKGN